MRRKEQLSLVQPWIEHPHARELEMIGRILDQEPGIADRVEQELVRGVKHPHLGRSGMTGSQVVRVMVIKQLRELRGACVSSDGLGRRRLGIVDSAPFPSSPGLPA